MREMTASAGQRVLVFPARTQPGSTEGQVWFLFSLSQVEDILKEAAVCRVPFSPSHIEGVANWRDRVIPVIALEKCLGLEPDPAADSGRLIMVKSGGPESGERAMLRVSPSIRMMSPPIPSAPLASVNWIPKRYLVRGIYRWEKGFIVIVHMERILRGRR